MKNFLVFVLLLTIFGLTGCSHIEDTNGEDDFSITTITDQDIINGMNDLSVGSISSSKKTLYLLIMKLVRTLQITEKS